MKATSMRADTTYFSNLNPNYHEFLQSYSQYKDFSKINHKKMMKEEDGNEIINEAVDEQKILMNCNSNSSEIKKELLKNPEDKEDYEDRLYYDYHFINDKFTGN